MTTETKIESIRFADLPAIGAEFAGGVFAGVTTKKDGTHCAVSRLPEDGSDLTWKKAMTDAQKRGGELPTKAVAALVTSTLKIPHGWYWTQQELEGDASSAWTFYSDGSSYYFNKSAAGGSLAVRLIPIID